MMKKGFSRGLGIIGAIFVILLVAPWLISLNQYKAVIQQKALEATGREIIINGDVRFGILPSPYARLTDVLIKNPAGTITKEFATIESLDVGVALLPLLSKEVQIKHITITKPAISLEAMANGGNNWGFTPQKTTEAATPTTSESSDSKLSIDDFTIEKGYVRYIDVPGKSQQSIGPIDGKFKLESLQGPISGKGTLTYSDLPVDFDAQIASLPAEENGVIPFKLSLDMQRGLAKAEFNGSIQKGDSVSARTETAIAVSDLEKILAALSKDKKSPSLPDYLKGTTNINGVMEYKDKQAKLSNMMIRAGGMEISASLLADLQSKKSITLDITNMVLPPETAGKASDEKSEKASDENLATTLEKSFASAVGILDTELPKSPLDLVVTASQLALPGQPVLRDVRLAASSSPNGVTIQNVEAKLAGNTFVQLQGELPARQDGKIDTAKINAKFTTQNMSAALGKADTASAMPLNLQTSAVLSRQNLRLQPLQIIQNGQTVQGNVLYTPKADVALIVDIKGSALDLDNLMGKDKKAVAAETTAQKSAVPENNDPLAKLQGLKAHITADLGSVTYKAKTARQVSLQADISNKGLSLSQARIGDLGGMVVTAKGKVDRLSPLKGAAFAAQAQTPSLSQTLKSLGNENAANLGASNFDIQLSGDTNDLKVGINGTIDQGKIAINGTAKNLNDAPGFTGKIDITHPETATIVRNFGGLKPTVNLGAFALQTALTYGTDTLKADDLVVKLGSAGTLQGHVNVVPDKNTRKIDADLKADKLALAALMGDDTQTTAAAVDTTQAKKTDEGWSKEPINLSSLRNLNGSAKVSVGELLYKKFIIKNFKTDVKFANNQVNVSTFKGNLFDAGDFSVNGQLAPGAEGQAHRGDFDITVDKTDAAKLFVALGSEPFKKGTLDMNQKLAFNGASPYALVSSLNGDGQIKITDGVVNGIDLDALAAKLDRPNSLSDFAAIMDQARAGGQTAIGNVTIPVTIRNGIVQVQNTTVKTQKTEMAMNGTVSLPPKTVDLTGQISFTEQRNLPTLALQITGPMSAPKKSFDTRSFTNFYAQKATEKLQEKVQDKLGKILGLPKAETPAAPEAMPAPVAPTETAPAENSIPTPTAPTAPVSPSAAPAPTSKKNDRDEALKQLGGQMLNNLFGARPKN